MKISRFIHVISDTKIWNALSKEIITLNKDVIDFIIKNKGVNDINNYPPVLFELGIVTTPEKERQMIKNIIEQITDKQFQSLFLIATTECNLDCDYCFYRSSSSESLKKREKMSVEIAIASIDKFKSLTSSNRITSGYWQQITFYGGEPLLNKKLLKVAIPYARQIFQDNYTTIVVNTNITLLDGEVIKLFKNNDVEVQISIDGNEEIHNRYRKTVNGSGTYDIVIKNIKRLVQSGVKVLPMITATDANVKNLSETIKSIVDETGVKDFAVNVLISESFKVDEQYTELLAEQMILAYQSYGDLANDYAFYELYEMLLGNDKRIARNSCGSTRKITIFPNGNVHSCQALEKVEINNMGNIHDQFISNENWKLWRYRNRFNNEECLNCEVVASCGAGCATGSYNSTGSIYGIDLNNCEYTKKLFKKLVLEKKID